MEWKNGMVSMIDQLLPLPLPADKTRIQLWSAYNQPTSVPKLHYTTWSTWSLLSVQSTMLQCRTYSSFLIRYVEAAL